MLLDNVLSEMALSNAHTELYFKFVRKKFVVSATHSIVVKFPYKYISTQHLKQLKTH